MSGRVFGGHIQVVRTDRKDENPSEETTEEDPQTADHATGEAQAKENTETTTRAEHPVRRTVRYDETSDRST
jgi:hypothetical protein